MQSSKCTSSPPVIPTFAHSNALVNAKNTFACCAICTPRLFKQQLSLFLPHFLICCFTVKMSYNVALHHIVVQHFSQHHVGSQFTVQSVEDIAALIHQTFTGYDMIHWSGNAWCYTKTFPFQTGIDYTEEAPAICNRVQVVYDPLQNLIRTAFPLV